LAELKNTFKVDIKDEANRSLNEINLMKLPNEVSNDPAGDSSSKMRQFVDADNVFDDSADSFLMPRRHVTQELSKITEMELDHNMVFPSMNTNMKRPKISIR
jgi:hypothetical protein